MQTLSRDETKELLDQHADLNVIEVLGPEAYSEFHLPRARNVPLDDEFDQHIQTEVPNKNSPVLVYCQSASCDAAPQAAERMEQLGYQQVYDYEAGKVDWKTAGLPVES